MLNIFKLNLQLFGGEGAASGASASGSATSGEGVGQATTGENATAAAEQRLRELGVPEAKIRKSASKVAANMPKAVAKPSATAETNVESASTEEEKPTTEDTTGEAPKRMSWKEIMADPEYNKEMQAVMRARLKDANIARESLDAMAPAIEVLARKYKLDSSDKEFAAKLAKAVEDDDAFYEARAEEMGVSVETAKRIDRAERGEERQRREAERTLQEQKFQEHMDKLEKQAVELQKVFPKFDLRTELQNPTFARLTHPSIGMSVEDAYHAVHRREIRAAEMQVTAQRTAEQVSNAIASGARRPTELGASSQAPSVSTFDYRNASTEQRNALKKRIREAAARGEKLYPGQ